MDKTHYKELIEKYFEETITDVEIKELSDWIKNDRQLHDWWEQEFERSDSSMNPVLRDKLFARIKEETLGKEVRPLRIIPWKWVAAILLPVCVAFFTYYLLDSSPTAETPFIVKAGKGDKATIELPDGTNVVLNSASQLSYLNNFGENVRRVQLNGEAYFKVAKNTEHPFVVTAGELEVLVTGTTFGVRAYIDEKDIQTTLESGQVTVRVEGKSVKLVPNKQVLFNKLTMGVEVRDVDVDLYLAWADGRLVYDNCPLEKILTDLGRWYNIDVFYSRDELRSYQFSLNMKKHEEFIQVLELIGKTGEVQFEVKDNTVIVR